MDAKWLILLALTSTLPSCARVAVEGGDKPIHIVMDINIRVDRELEQFFAFEQQYRAVPPTPQTTMPAQSSSNAATAADSILRSQP